MSKKKLIPKCLNVGISQFRTYGYDPEINVEQLSSPEYFDDIYYIGLLFKDPKTGRVYKDLRPANMTLEGDQYRVIDMD